MTSLALVVALDPHAAMLRITRAPDGEAPPITHTVHLGEPGRHGHQGWIDERWATFDGAVLAAAGPLADESTLQLRFQLPPGWRLVTGLPGRGTTRTLEGSHGRSPWQILRSTCIAAGPFVRRSAQGSPLQVFTLPDHALPEQVQHAAAVWRVAHDALGFAPPHGYTVAWGPPAPGGEPVHGGTNERGSCTSHDGSHRPLELMAHRLAHAVNRDGPWAAPPPHPRDHWFVEGFATWFEHEALRRAEVPGRARLPAWRARADRIHRQHPSWRVPLGSEPRVSGDLAEHLHYVRGPLAAHALDQALRERSGKDLLSFVAHLAHTRQRPDDLRRAIARWSGVTLDDVFARYVESASPPSPR